MGTPRTVSFGFAGTVIVFALLVSSVVCSTEESDRRNRPTKSASNGTQRLQLADFDFAHVETPYVISLWILLACVAKIGFHLYNKLSSIFPESCLLIVLGVVVGVILYFSKAATSEKYTLSPNTFFLFLLPPIVLDAGYFMPNRAFFDNIGTILLFAVVGTLFNTVAIGAALYGVSAAGWIGVNISLLHCFVFSSLISAVDPVAVLAVFEEIHVNEMLYIIVFGESLLNDAVTVVLYHMMETYSEIGEEFIQPVDIVSGIGSFFVVAVCGTLIGVLFGFLSGFITKYTDHVRVIEPLFVFVLSYLSYLTSEMLHLSGILAIVFCGIVMKQYVEANVSKKSITTIKYFMKMLANISETIIFMFLGLSTVVDNHDWNVPFILFTVLFTLVFRAIGVVVLTWFANRIRLCRLSKVDQFVMSYGGLRGAIALGLVLLLNEEIVQEKRMMVTACIVVVFFTVFVQGITIKPLVNFLKVKKADKRMPSMNEQINDRLMDHLMAGIEDVAGYYGHHWMRDKYELFNNKYLKPLLMREKPKTRETKIFHVFTKLNMKEAMDHLATHGSFNLLDMAKEPSLARIIRSYSGQSLPEQALNDSEPAVQSEELEKSDTILDMAAVEAKYSKKMADDSKIHHILDDAMFVPRRRFSTSQKHVLPDLHNHPPFKHNMRKEIRHLAALQRARAQTTKPRSDHYQQHGQTRLSPHKNVSFSQSVPLNQGRQSGRFQEENNLTEEEDEGITFTARYSDEQEDQQDSSNIHSNDKPSDTTVTEKQLPWRRATSRDESPHLSEAPSWAKNLDYHGLTESGSPYSSPQTTIQGKGDDTPPNIFDVFPRTKSEDADSAVGVSYECLTVCLPPEDGQTEENTDNPSADVTSGVRENTPPPSRHRDSGVIDTEDVVDLPNGLSNDSTQQTDANPASSDGTEETKL